jgi:four helix bundle protein
MYEVSRRLPAFEKFELASQIRRAAVSLTNNLAEGHGRFHYLDQIRFTLIARGSLEELIDDLNTCEDETYLKPPEASSLRQEAWQIHRVMAGYLRFLRGRKEGESLVFKEPHSTYGDPEEEMEAIFGTEASASSTLRPFNPSTHR